MKNSETLNKASISTMAEIRNHQTVDLLNRVDKCLGEMTLDNNSRANESTELTSIHNGIKRARKEFDASMFFVNVFGPLKAGKSTLVNLLVGDYVCPAKYGAECTLRPSIIINSGKRMIEQYNTCMDSNKHRTDIFDKVIDVIRGIEDKDTLEGSVSTKEHKLSVHNINKLLTEEIENEPLITVIHVDSSEFGDDIALVDMPGLDGNASNFKSDAIYNRIIERSDLLLFVQSSISSLNLSSSKLLDVIKNNSSELPPISLIHNNWNSRSWRKTIDSSIDNKNKKKSRQDIEGRIGKKLDSTNTFNLGKIDDIMNKKEAVKENERDLLSNEEDLFIEFRNDLRKNLAVSKASIKEKTALGKIFDTFEKAGELMKGMRYSLIKEQVDFKDNCKAYDDIADSHRANDYTGSTTIERVEHQVLEPIINDKKDKALKSLESETTIQSERIKRKKTGKDLNRILEGIARKVQKHCLESINGGLKSQLESGVNSIIQDIEKSFKVSIKDNKNINQYIGSSNLCFLSPFVFNENSLSVNTIKEKKWFIFEKNYDCNKAQEEIRFCTDSMKQELSDYYISFKEALNEDIMQKLFQREETIQACISRAKSEFQRNHESRSKEIDSIIEFTLKYERLFNDLKSHTVTCQDLNTLGK